MKTIINRYRGSDGIVNACKDATVLWLVSVLMLAMM